MRLQPTFTEARYVIVADGEGASACVLADDDLETSVHQFMCVCGKPWRDCDSGTQQETREIGDASKWTTDDDGTTFSITWPHETGKLTLYKLSQPVRTIANFSRMWQLIRAFVENETSQTSYAELRGSNSMDIPCEFLALCEFAEEMGVKLP